MERLIGPNLVRVCMKRSMLDAWSKSGLSPSEKKWRLMPLAVVVEGGGKNWRAGSVVARVTWRPLERRSLPRLSMGFMWPRAANATINICVSFFSSFKSMAG